MVSATLEKVRVSRGGGTTEASPRQTLALTGDKWAVLVITALAGSSRRYNARSGRDSIKSASRPCSEKVEFTAGVYTRWNLENSPTFPPQKLSILLLS